MRTTVKMVSVLTVVGLISGAALVLVFRYADPRITKNRETETDKAVFRIFPDGAKYRMKKMGDETIFSVLDKEGKLLGYAFAAEGNGYQGTIKMMAGVLPDLETLTGIEILESQETPGLGQEIAGKKFKEQFRGLKTSPQIDYVKNKKPDRPNVIEAITGATISSRAVVTILNKKIEEIRKNAESLR